MAPALERALVSARQKCLTEDEAYWDPKPNFTRPVSARNEAAALSWLLDHQAVVCRGGPADVEELHALCASYIARLAPGRPAPEDEGATATATATAAAAEAAVEAATASPSGRSFDEASAEAALQRWCAQKGLRGAASPALFGGGGGGGGGGEGGGGAPPPLRGLRADGAVAPGDVVLHVPADLLISYDTAKQSDLGKVLVALPLGLAEDDVALIWTCVERREPEAAAAAFWAALPERFATVLSASDAEVALLEGTPLHAEAVQARQHLAAAFASAAPAFESLLRAYPTYFQPGWFSWESYLWAAELWYSYGIQVQFGGGDIRTCLAPYVGLMNHHPLPHVVHFSKIDPATGCLRVRAFRPCAPGRQLFLSYGPYPNAKLLLFYGFAVPDNPFEEVDVALQVPAGPSAGDRRALLAAAGLSLQHRVRRGGGLAPSLLAAARLLAAPPERLRQLRGMPPAEVRAALSAPLQRAGGDGSDGGGDGAGGAAAATLPPLDAAALRIVAAPLAALLGPAEACAARLEAASSSGTDGGGAAAGDAARGELGRFARVYVQGLLAVLREATQAVHAALGGA